METSNLDNDKPSKELRKACRDGHFASAEKSLTLGANINAKDGRGWSALHLAIPKNHIEIVKWLILQGASVNSTTNESSTPLLVAAYNGKVDICKLLLENGADLEIKDHEGKTALDIALQRKKSLVVNLLSTWKQKEKSEVINEPTNKKLRISKTIS